MMTSICAWQPHLSISGCVAAFDLTDPSSYTVTGGTTVTSITNKASGVAWTEATNPPGYLSSGINGLPAMTGDGATQRIISSEAAVVAAVSGTNPSYSALVVTDPVSATVGCWLGFGDAATANQKTHMFYQNPGTAVIQQRLQRGQDAGATNIRTNVNHLVVPHVGTWRMNGSSCTAYMNATRTLNGSAYSTAITSPTRAALYCRPDSAPDNFFPGRTSVILLFNRDIGDDALRLYSRYLARHGIS